MIFFDERFHDFFVERLHDFCEERLRDVFVWRGCVIFLTHSQCCLIFFVERLRDFFVDVA